MRNTYSSKTTNPTKISVVLLLAGKSRQEELGHKSLWAVNGQKLIQHQLDVISRLTGLDEVWAVVGHEKERLLPYLKGVRVLENPNFDKTNVNKNIALALRACPQDSIMFVYGDLLFNLDTFSHVVRYPGTSYLLYDRLRRIHYSKTGLILQKDVVTNLTYGVEPKWGQIAYVSSAYADNFRRTVFDNEQKNVAGYELVNMAIDNGCIFQGTCPETANFVEVDSVKQINNFLKKEII